jgi:Asp-tRNA(Asn)/Glu-tRNA(Gln) amidotransferase A subunit family amidase
VRELTTLSAFDVRELIRARAVSPVEVTEHCLERIEEHDATLAAWRRCVKPQPGTGSSVPTSRTPT